MVEKTYKEKIDRIRERTDILYLKSPNSPLTPEQKLDFKGLSYFPMDEKYRFIVELKEYENQEEVTISTTKNETRHYIRLGHIEFEIDGQMNNLTVYKAAQDEYFFLPFQDSTTGNETYYVGRYVEIERVSKGKYEVDFNQAYNPLCAYNDKWNCTKIPEENILSIPIPAGLKKYDDYRPTK
ncbi:MAG: DUF1684 domain-containing protein [Candidatus Heimdallarchaeaceae archaeon]